MKRIFYLLLDIALLAFTFFGIPDSIMYDTGQDIISWLPFFLLFVIHPILVYKIANTFDIKRLYALGIAAASLLILGPAWGLYLDKNQSNQLTKDGMVTIGIVYTKWMTIRRHERLVRCKFLANNRMYSTFSVQDKNNLYKVGDTIHILYSASNPGNCIITELEKQ